VPLPVAERWFAKPEVLAKSAGMHRFVWNLTWASSGGPSADEDAEYRNPTGPKAAPGKYLVRLTVDGKALEQSLTVVMDPRSQATPEVLAQQVELGLQMFGESIEARRAMAEIASVQKQLADIRQKVGQEKRAQPSKKLKQALADAESAIVAIMSGGSAGLQDAYTGLASALRVVETGDRAVPSQAIAVYEQSSKQIKARIVDWSEFKKAKLATLNQQLGQSQMAPIKIAAIEQEVETLLSN